MITNQQYDMIGSLLDARDSALKKLLTTPVSEDTTNLAFDFVQATNELEAYLLGLTEPTAAEDGWIVWGGGECPVPTGTQVFVRYRDGQEKGPLASNLESGEWRDASADYWENDGYRNDIVAYRLL